METIESVRQVEEAVICALLSSESAIWQVTPVLKPEMFSDVIRICLQSHLFPEQPG